MPRIISAPLPLLADRLPDRVGTGLRVLFVGINPGVRSSLTGHHFAGHSNRFWRLMYDSGLVPEPVTYLDDVRMPDWGYGMTNLVERPTPGIATLTPAELLAGRTRLLAAIDRLHPCVVAIVGVTVFRAIVPERRGAIVLGVQPERIGDATVCVLPNPSGRNAHYSYAQMLAAFRALAAAVDTPRPAPAR